MERRRLGAVNLRSGNRAMQRVKHPPARNKIDLADPAQVRVWTKRLDVSADDLKIVVDKVGNAIAAVTKEVELQRANRQPSPQEPPALPESTDGASSVSG